MRHSRRWTYSFLTLCATASLQAAPVTINDDADRHVVLAALPQRIISLAPSATEMLFAAGLGERLIATVDYSDEPAAAQQIPRIGNYNAVDLERLVALHPDLVVVWPGGNNLAQVEKIARLGIPVYRQQVSRLRDLPVSLRRLGALAADPSVAEAAAQQLDEQLAHLASRHDGPQPATAKQQPTVFLEVWNKPTYTVGGGQLMSDALEACGTRNVFADLQELAPVIDTEAVIGRNPDIIVAAAPPGQAHSWLEEWRKFGSLKAVRAGKLLPFEDTRLVHLGPSFVAATEALCAVLNP